MKIGGDRMRLIDADALKKSVPNTHVNIFENCRNCELLDDEQVEELIDNAPTIDAVPKWIPCEERLPEPTQEVLVTGINGCVYTSRIVHGEFEYGGNVIAWMPLPEPYKGERKDDE